MCRRVRGNFSILMILAGLAAPAARGDDAPPAPPDPRLTHWSYQPVRAVEPPAVRNESGPLTPVDRFILAKLEQSNLPPAPPADRHALVRRIHFDLTGLPPAPADVGAFVNDASPNAVATLVDRLLASPAFGERWGRHWLDVARFAESSGGGRSVVFADAWRYRDYVVDAFNRDKPFDAFVREQIAGDLVPGGSIEERRARLIATGFLALGPKNLDHQDKDELRMDVVDEQLDTVGRAFMGLSLGCTRCHDHKFEPIPIEDYYALAGIFRSTKTLTPGNVSGFVQVELPEEKSIAEQRKRHAEALAAAEARVREATEALTAIDPGAVPTAGSVKDGGLVIADPSTLPGVVVDDTAAEATGAWKASTFHPSYVGRGYVHDDNADKGRRSLRFVPDLPAAGEYEIRLAYAPGGNRATNVPIRIVYDGGEKTVSVNERQPGAIDGLFVSLGRFTFAAGPSGSVTLSNDGTDGHVIADAVQFLPVAAADQPAPSQPQSSEPGIAAARERLKAANDAVAALKMSAPPPAPTAIGVRDEQEVGDYHVCVRGDVHLAGAPVARGFLSAVPVADVPQIGPGSSGRRELAEWLTRPDHPLTSRVIVNRIWHHLFGAGLVRTPDDFGTTGDPPSHRELLDWLAADFVRGGWSVKRMVRQLVLSRAYQLSAEPVAGAAEADPENRLLSRANRKRLDAEALRDAMLLLAGRLDTTVGGPVFRGGEEFGYDFATDGSAGRRTLYVPVLRYAPHEVREAFDFADPNFSCGARNVSTLATQALYLMNSAFAQDSARAAAKRLIADAGPNATADARLGLAYHRALGRPPTDAERELAIAYVNDATNADDAERWARLHQALFASIDFRYLK